MLVCLQRIDESLQSQKSVKNPMHQTRPIAHAAMEIPDGPAESRKLNKIFWRKQPRLWRKIAVRVPLDDVQ